ncbi:MAG TPA: ABC transporter permease, partial [Candidatus Synoicihabitans sp.]|nr:ABC transporter permease [Candidatus Synoicihabitans sp.]
MTLLRITLRRLIGEPAFTATVLLTLALCIAANVAIFAVVDAILVRSLPLPEPSRLVVVFNGYPGAGVERAAASVANYFDRREGLRSFSSISLMQDGMIGVGAEGAPQRVPMARVTPEFFTTLQVPLALGRPFADAELTYGTDEVAILTHEFWQTHFDGDPKVLGRTFINDGITITVVGVLPSGFRFLSSPARFFRPLSHDPQLRSPDSRHNNNAMMIARLAPGVTAAAAQAELDAFNANLIANDPLAELIRNAGYHTTVYPLHADHVRTIKPILLLLQAGVLFLLLIGAVNLANLLLIRASGRTKELSVRQALGASRRHIIRDAALETVLLALVGGGLGLLLGAFGIELLGRLGTGQLPLGTTIVFDG